MEWECWKFRRKPGKTNQKRKTKKKKRKKGKREHERFRTGNFFRQVRRWTHVICFGKTETKKKKYNLSIVNCQMSDVSCQLQQLMRIALHCDRKSKTKTKNKV